MQTVNTLLKARKNFGFQVFVLDGVNIAFVVDEVFFISILLIIGILFYLLSSRAKAKLK